MLGLIESRDALWNGKLINYEPGQLRLAIKKGYNKKGYASIHDHGGVIIYTTMDGEHEVSVPCESTLRIAAELSRTRIFEYVEPIIKENYN